MQAVMGMDPDKMILIFPAALVAIFIVVTLQKYMCDRPNVYMGLVLPGLCFIAATIMAVRPFFVVGPGEHVGFINFCLRMWLTFNIPTIVFMFPFLKSWKQRKMQAEAQQSTQPDTQQEQEDVL